MFWLVIAIFSYFLWAICALIDKYLLTGRLLTPKIYAFYAGILNILVLVLIPFDFFVPKLETIIIAFLAGIFSILGLYTYFKTVREGEISRVVPAIGGLLPIFVFFGSLIFLTEEKTLSFSEIISFFLLILGTVIISSGKKSFSGKKLEMAVFTAFLMAISFILTKIVFLSLTLINGIIWTRFGVVLIGIIFLFSREVREEVFKKRTIINPKILKFLIPNQLVSVAAFFLQTWAIFMVPFNYLAFINALQGTQYVFLLILAVFVSLKFPQILKEEISRKVLFQKIIAILLIGGGLVLLVFK